MKKYFEKIKKLTNDNIYFANDSVDNVIKYFLSIDTNNYLDSKSYIWKIYSNVCIDINLYESSLVIADIFIDMIEEGHFMSNEILDVLAKMLVGDDQYFFFNGFDINNIQETYTERSKLYKLYLDRKNVFNKLLYSDKPIYRSHSIYIKTYLIYDDQDSINEIIDVLKREKHPIVTIMCLFFISIYSRSYSCNDFLWAIEEKVNSKDPLIKDSAYISLLNVFRYKTDLEIIRKVYVSWCDCLNNQKGYPEFPLWYDGYFYITYSNIFRALFFSIRYELPLDKILVDSSNKILIKDKLNKINEMFPPISSPWYDSHKNFLIDNNWSMTHENFLIIYELLTVLN